MIKRLLYIALIFIGIQPVLAQESSSMYFMQSLPQTKWVNPAKQSEHKVTLGGVAIPITGQLFLPIHLNYQSNLALEDILQYNSELDSLVLPGFKGFDKKRFYDKLQDVNSISFETGLHVLSIGYKAKTWQFGLDIRQKIYTKFSFNKDLVKFVLDGNTGDAFWGKTAHLGAPAIDMTSYIEYALSVSKKINEKLTVGLSPKLLMGQASVWTEKNVLDVHTSDQENYPTTINADILIHSSQPVVEVTDAYYDYEGDSLVFEKQEKKLSATSIAFNTKNMGFGVDLGVIYKPTTKIEIHASLVDFGYINWKDNSQSFSVKGEYIWNGYDFQPELTENSNIIEEHEDSLRDGFIRAFNPDFQEGSYKSYLTPKAYLGGTFSFGEATRVGLLFRGAFHKEHFRPSVTLSGNFKIGSWFEAVTSFTAVNNTYDNIGLGFVLRGAIFQIFMMTDTSLGCIYPQSAKNLTFRMGMNLMIGREKEKEHERKKQYLNQ